MICLICRQAEIVNGLTSMTFERGEVRLVVNKVPAHICPSCRESYVDEEVAMQLLQDLDKMSNAGEMDGILEFMRN